MYFCDPAWHTGPSEERRTVPARFFIKPPDMAAGAMSPAFAACEEHTGRAIALMMARHGYASVVVRDVSGRVEAAAASAAPPA